MEITAKDFLIQKKVILKGNKDLIIGFDNGTEESLVKLLNDFVKLNLPVVCSTFKEKYTPNFLKWLNNNYTKAEETVYTNKVTGLDYRISFLKNMYENHQP